MAIKQLAHIGEIEYQSGARRQLYIPRYAPLLELMLKLNFTITNGGAAAVGPLYQTLARILRRIEVTVNGRDTIINISGETAAALAFIEQGIVAKGMDSAVVLTSGAATAYEIFLPIRFTLPRGLNPDDTALDFRRGIEATLTVQFANSDCSDFYTTPNSAALSGVTCEVSGLYYLDAPADKVYRTRTLDQLTPELTASSSAFQISLDKGSGVLIRSLLLETIAASVGTDAILANGMLELSVGTSPIWKAKAKHIKALMQHDYMVAPQTGVYHAFMPTYGQGISMLPTKGLNTDMVLKLDATKQSGTNFVNVTREGFRDLAAVA